MVICLLGIFAHVLRKALKGSDQETSKSSDTFYSLVDDNTDDDSDSSDHEFKLGASSARLSRLTSPILPKEGLPLLEDDSEDSEVEVTFPRTRTRSTNSDDHYLKDTRTWTSTRDKHLMRTGSHFGEPKILVDKKKLLCDYSDE